MLDRTSTQFSPVKPADTAFKVGELRDFFLCRDLGIAQATHGKVMAHLVKANMAPEKGTGWHRHEADFKSVDVAPVCDVPPPAPWPQQTP